METGGDDDPRRVPRRAILASVSGALVSCLPHAAPPRAARRAPRVLVVGAGIAGLSAAYGLRRRGFDVVVLEARSRVGGRIETGHPASGVVVEHGATRILANHLRVRRYAAELGIALETIPAPSGDEVFVLGGARRVGVPRVGDAWPLDLPPDERHAAPSELTAKYLRPLVADVGDPLDDAWPGESAQAIDRMAKNELLARRGATAGAIRLMNLGQSSGWTDRMSALQSLRFLALNDLGRPSLRAVGGNDRLPRALAATLGGAVRCEAPVRRVAWDNREARVTLRNGDELAGDAVICTPPLPVLRSIELNGPLPASVREAIAEVEGVPVLRIDMTFGARPWQAEGLSGFMSGDAGIAEIWNLAAGELGARGRLTCYVAGTPARTLSVLPAAERDDAALRAVELAFPGAARVVEAMETRSWHNDPWARGGWPLYRPGQLSRLHRPLQELDGRFVLASDYLSSRVGWIEGALESAERAVDAIERTLSVAVSR